MISRTAADVQLPDWRREMAQAITDPAELLRLLHLPAALLPAARAAARDFGLRVPRAFVALMEPGNAADPLLRQVLPLAEELAEQPGYVDDPVGDAAAARAAGVLAKYHGRALLLASPACAVHCRYCFRRSFPYQRHRAAREQWRPAVEALARDPGVREVILSGGDPLSLDDARLDELIGTLEGLPQLQRLRIHTRLPVVIPARVTPQLVERLARCRLSAVVVLHFNHPRELPDATARHLRPLREAALLLNQTVLLRGVNDDADVLARLSERLFDSGILPYYIHALDRVRGAAHFDLPERQAVGLMSALRGLLPGYLVPRLVRELPGEPAKTPLY